MKITIQQLIALLQLDLTHTRQLLMANKSFETVFFVEKFGLNFQILDIVLSVLGVPENAKYSRDFWYEKFFALEKEQETDDAALRAFIDDALAFGQHRRSNEP